MTKSISQKLANKTFKELGIDPKTGKPLSSRTSPARPSKLQRSGVNSPFRIPALDKTRRQAQSTQGCKASAAWQTASLLRDLILLWTPTLSHKFPFSPACPVVTTPRREDVALGSGECTTGVNPLSHVNPGTISRLRSQLEDAARSMVSTLEEGWGRPSTKEYLDFIGFSQGSLTEIRGDIERCLTDELIKPAQKGKYTKSIIPTPSRTHPYPPIKSRRNPVKYGNLRVKLREYTGKEINPKDLSYQVFTELINKTDYLFKKTVDGLQQKMITDEKKKLNDEINTHWRKHW